MKLENQVCSLELAKKLKELGTEQKSAFYWRPFWWDLGVHDQRPGYRLTDRPNPNTLYKLKGKDEELQEYSAFTVAELGELLPAYFLFEELRYDLNIWKDAGWHVAYWWDEDTRRLSDLHFPIQLEATEADARAKMLVYLLEQKLKTI